MYGVIRQLADKVGIENIKTSDPVSVIQQVDISVHFYEVLSCISTLSFSLRLDLNTIL